MIVFIALLIGTIITVLASYVDFGGPGMNIAVALLIGLLTPIVAGIPAVRRLQEAESRAVLDS